MWRRDPSQYFCFKFNRDPMLNHAGMRLSRVALAFAFHAPLP